MQPHLDPAVAGRLVSWLEERRADMAAELSALVALESPSTEPATQWPVQDRLARRLEDVGYRCRIVPGRATGGYLVARPRGRGACRQLVIGHTDTVWPLGTLREMPITIDGDVLSGPGAFDMKAGLVQAVFAVAALDSLGLHPEVAPLVLFTSDEETGSRESARAIRRYARLADRALVIEPGLGPDGHLKTARKGIGQYTIVVHGRAAHAGLDPTAGASAIHALAHVILALDALNDPDAGISVNVGIVEGGLRSNVVAPEARAVVDVRAPTAAAAAAADRAIHAVTSPVAGTAVVVRGQPGRAPLERTAANMRLWRLAQAAGRTLGLALDHAAVGGGSDGNLTSPLTPTLDGLGAVGDGAHARHEHVRLDRMAERAALLALILLAPPFGAGGERPGADGGSPGGNNERPGADGERPASAQGA